MNHCITVSLYRCIALPLYHCITESLYQRADVEDEVMLYATCYMFYVIDRMFYFSSWHGMVKGVLI